jgi:hypothetical protein
MSRSGAAARMAVPAEVMTFPPTDRESEFLGIPLPAKKRPPLNKNHSTLHQVDKPTRPQAG